MRRALAFLAALVAGTLGASVQAAPTVAAAAQWHRVATTDDARAVSLPCAESDSKVAVQGSVLAASCDHAGISYVAQFGTLSAGGGVGSYTEVLASARKDPTAGKIVETTIAGHRAFTVTRYASDPVGYGAFVDLAPGALVSLIAFEPDGKDRLSGTGRDAAVADAQRFIASLELPAK